MAKDSKKPAASWFPFRKSPNKNIAPSKLPPEEFKHALEAALAANDYARALGLVDTAPRWIQKQPDFMLLHASLLLAVGNKEQAFQLVREIERKHSGFPAIHMPLAVFYMQQQWPAHALQAAQRALLDRNLDDESRATMTQLMQAATDSIQHDATKLNIPIETMRRAFDMHERALMAMGENKLLDVAQFSKEAIKLAPSWDQPYHIRAQALFYSGKVDEAISVLEAVLARDAENVVALSNLVTSTYGLNQPGRAREYADRIARLVHKFPPGSQEIDHAITAFALVEDTPTLWEIAKQYLDAPADSLTNRSWLCLAVAAIRSGKWKETLKLLKKVDGKVLSPLAEPLLDELKAIAAKRNPRLAWMPPMYPGADLYFHPKVMAEWEVIFQKISTSYSPSLERKFNELVQKYPFFIVAMKRLLWSESTHQGVLDFLSIVDRADMDEEILRFGLSQTGPRETRLRALMGLVQEGRYTGPKIVEIWDEDLNEWREVELFSQQIGEVDLPIQPETNALMEKALKAKDPNEAISWLQKAFEKEPTNPVVLFNLGVLYIQNGREEEGNELFYRSVEVAPDYTYGHASIALSEAQQGNEQEAMDHLAVVSRADVITPDTAVIANLAWLVLALDRNDLKSARQRFEMAVQVNPDHQLIKFYEKVLKEAEAVEKKVGFIWEYQRKSNRRAHQKLLKTTLSARMDLRACMETNTKEMLLGIARFWDLPSSGKKGELASRLADGLLEPGFLQAWLEGKFSKKEREALLWMLEGGGVRPWKEFAIKFGENDEESLFWKYHEPKSVPGRLRMSGLFYSGILEGQTVAYIPVDVRPILQKLL